MNDLALRLAALDPEAGAAVRVISHFDGLVAARAGLHTIVRDAAALAGCPVRLTDPAHRLTVRVLPDGTPGPAGAAAADPGWPAAAVTPDGAVLVLERAAPAGTVDAVLLERAAAAARSVLERTRGRGPADDPASVELVLDAAAPVADRRAAARRLGLTGPVRAVAPAEGSALVLPASGSLPPGVRAGVGPAGPLQDLPTSWDAARLALRLTAEGTDADPGPRVVHADQLGALALLVRTADAATGPVPDVRAVDRAAATAPWVLATLHAVAEASSLRDAARSLGVHHSTLADRLPAAESALGWEVRGPQGRLRLQVALLLRRARRSYP